MRAFLSIQASLLFSFLICGCGSSNGSDSPIVRVSTPAMNSVFAAGTSIEYRLELENFALAQPVAAGHSKHHPGDDHTADDHGSTIHEEMDESTEHEENHQDDHHDEMPTLTNPLARVGHYHVYLDEATGSDAHLTAWTESGSYELPLDLASGVHTLRFELRDNLHVPIGTPESEAVLFFEVR